MRNKIFVFALVFCLISPLSKAASFLGVTPEQQSTQAKAIFRGTVLKLEAFRGEADGRIHTRTIFKVDETLKGTLPGCIQVIHPGGILDGEAEIDGFSPRSIPGEERVVFLGRRADGSLYSLNGTVSSLLLSKDETGKPDYTTEQELLLQNLRQQFPNPAQAGEDVRDQAVAFPKEQSASVVGGLIETNGIASRFLAPDRGEAIPYIVDAQALPSGVTLNQALNAISNAFKAWSDASSLKFSFEGTQNFGQPASSVSVSDRKIRIQLHDLYNSISEPNVLGRGGRAFSIPGLFPNGGGGGKVGSREFHESTRGYVVIKHTKSSVQNVTTLTEVLCHEIGHVLSLDHSSENSSESNPTLSQAIMFFQAHADGRGATLGSYDAPMIRTVHPFNTPPFTHPRVIDVVTAPTTPNVSGINRAELRGYDLQNDSLALVSTNATANYVNFSFQGNTLLATPKSYSGGDRIDPALGSFYDGVYVRFTDAANASPFVLIRVISFMPDSQPVGASDGLPDSWMTQYFGTTAPSSGAKTRAQDDYDNDGSNNLEEFIAGTSPTDANSVLKITAFSPGELQWIAKPYDLYEVQVSTDLTSWTRAISPVLPTNDIATATVTNAGGHRFYRVERVP